MSKNTGNTILILTGAALSWCWILFVWIKVQNKSKKLKTVIKMLKGFTKSMKNFLKK
jgi:hypothetical protein